MTNFSRHAIWIEAVSSGGLELAGRMRIVSLLFLSILKLCAVPYFHFGYLLQNICCHLFPSLHSASNQQQAASDPLPDMWFAVGVVKLTDVTMGVQTKTTTSLFANQLMGWENPPHYDFVRLPGERAVLCFCSFAAAPSVNSVCAVHLHVLGNTHGPDIRLHMRQEWWSIYCWTWSLL